MQDESELLESLAYLLGVGLPCHPQQLVEVLASHRLHRRIRRQDNHAHQHQIPHLHVGGKVQLVQGSSCYSNSMQFSFSWNPVYNEIISF